jgi:hypothetical protein
MEAITNRHIQRGLDRRDKDKVTCQLQKNNIETGRGHWTAIARVWKYPWPGSILQHLG